MTDSKPKEAKRNINVPLSDYDLAGRIVAAKILEGDKTWDLGRVGSEAIHMLYASLPAETRELIERFQNQDQPTEALQS